MATPPPSLTSRDKLAEIIRALVALTHAVPGCHSICTMSASQDFVRLSVTTQEALVSLSAVLDAGIKTVSYGDREWEVGLATLGEISVEISGPHRDKKPMPEPEPVEIDADAALAQANGALS